MVQKKKLRAPMGIAGLTRYEEEEKSLITLKPQHVIGIAVALVVLELLLFLSMPL
jgi:preprotein translocase subunit Sec61beta